MAYKITYRSEGGFSQRSSLLGDHQQLQVKVDSREEIDNHVSGLRAQLHKLKHVASEIHNETKQQQELMQQLEQALISGQAAIKNGVRKLNRALASSGSAYLVHVILFALFCFFLVYLWSKFS